MALDLFRVDNGFNIDEEASVLHGDADPSISGLEAEAGSLYLRNIVGTDGGELWLKAGDADTAWESVTNTNPSSGLSVFAYYMGED